MPRQAKWQPVWVAWGTQREPSRFLTFPPYLFLVPLYIGVSLAGYRQKDDTRSLERLRLDCWSAIVSRLLNLEAPWPHGRLWKESRFEQGQDSQAQVFFPQAAKTSF